MHLIAFEVTFLSIHRFLYICCFVANFRPLSIFWFEFLLFPGERKEERIFSSLSIFLGGERRIGSPIVDKVNPPRHAFLVLPERRILLDEGKLSYFFPATHAERHP